MPGYRSDIDPFKDIRVFPRDAAQLRHHLSHINHKLQTKYHISTELAELALQPDRAEEFRQHYQREIHRIIAQLNKSTKKSYTPRVDPTRIVAGFELTNDAAPASGRSGSTTLLRQQQQQHRSLAAMTPEQDAKWRAHITDTAKLLSQQQMVDAHRDAISTALLKTPASQQIYLTPKGSGTTGKPNDGIDSDVRRPNKESMVFSTPPDFNGFGTAGTSPSNGISPLS